jgi:hypothetical protein
LETAPFVKRELVARLDANRIRRYSWDMSIDIVADETTPTRTEDHFGELDLAGLLITLPSVVRI